MEKDVKDQIIKIIGFFLLFLGIFAIAYELINKNPDEILWLCYIALIILGIAIIQKNKGLILAEISILAIPLAIWNIDFLYYIITKTPLLGLTDYFFSPSRDIVANIISLQHFYTIPLALIALILIKQKVNFKVSRVIEISFIQMTILFVLGRIFTPPEVNMNCVFKSCIPITINLPYPIVWFSATFIMIFLSASAIKLIMRLSQKTHKK